MKEEIGDPLSWDELAKYYNKANFGRSAQTLPMNTVFIWAESQKNTFYVDPEKGTIHLKKQRS